MTELQKTKHRVKTIRAIRKSTELEGARSTAATRTDQLAYARGTITATELGDRVRRRYNVPPVQRPVTSAASVEYR